MEKALLVEEVDEFGANRDFVIYRLSVNEKANCSWPVNNMIFYKSTGTSNVEKGFEFLKNTYFPTTGLTCKLTISNDSNQNIYNNYNDHTLNPEYKIYNHVHGHVTKLSDYLNYYRYFGKSGIKKDETASTKLESVNLLYYEYKGIVDFLKFIINKIDILCSDDEFIRRNSDLIIEKQYNYKLLDLLFKIIVMYFSCEEQIKISYTLTDNNDGLWGWTFGDVSLIDICSERWGGLPEKVNKIRTIEYPLSSNEINNLFILNEANIEFNQYLNFLKENDLLLVYITISESYKKYNINDVLNKLSFIVNKANQIKRIEEKRRIKEQESLIAESVIPSLPIPQSIQQFIPQSIVFKEQTPPRYSPIKESKKTTKTKKTSVKKIATKLPSTRISTRRSTRIKKGGKIKKRKTIKYKKQNNKRKNKKNKSKKYKSKI